jgi:hypothetical protein
MQSQKRGYTSETRAFPGRERKKVSGKVARNKITVKITQKGFKIQEAQLVFILYQQPLVVTYPLRCIAVIHL